MPHHDHHGHGHGQAHASTDVGQQNKEYFDSVAATVWDKDWVRDLTQQVQNELQEQLQWINIPHSDTKEAKMLDYACGNGAASKTLASTVGKIYGIDISSGMVKQYNVNAEKEGFTLEKMHATAGDLLDSTDANLASSDFYGFDFAIMSMALHHVSDPTEMIARLAERLDEGGVLLIIDWVAASESGCKKLEGPAHHPVQHTVTRAGFEEKEVKQAFEKAGLKDWGWKWFSKRSNLPEEFGGENQMFLARGVKA